MSSTSIVDQVPQHVPRSEVGELLVLWQHPESRRIHPIGRLGKDGGNFTFTYTQHVREIDDFRPLPGLPIVGEKYCGTRMPTIFRQRTMSPTRPDFTAVMNEIGLPPDEATPWEQIVRSGGRRVGDTLQLMELPNTHDGHVSVRFFTNGIRHIPGGTGLRVGNEIIKVDSDAHELALGSLGGGDALQLVLEQGNPEDPHAVIVASGGTPVGWVPRVLSAGIRQLLQAGTGARALVHRVSGPSAPPHVRLVVDFEANAPADFTFDPAGAWAPLEKV